MTLSTHECLHDGGWGDQQCVYMSQVHTLLWSHMVWLRREGSLKLQVSFAKEPCTREYILEKIPVLLRSLLIVVTLYHILDNTLQHTATHCNTLQQVCSTPLQHTATHCSTDHSHPISHFRCCTLSLSSTPPPLTPLLCHRVSIPLRACYINCFLQAKVSSFQF